MVHFVVRRGPLRDLGEVYSYDGGHFSDRYIPVLMISARFTYDGEVYL
jgi:hypothetical protein